MSFAPDFAQECRWFADLAILVAGFSCEIPDFRGSYVLPELSRSEPETHAVVWPGPGTTCKERSETQKPEPHQTAQRQRDT